MSSHTPRVESFVLRFIADLPSDGAESAQHWHGVVVHVQSNEEKTFTHFADAVAFIARHVPGDFVIQEQDGKSEPPE